MLINEHQGIQNAPLLFSAYQKKRIPSDNKM